MRTLTPAEVARVYIERFGDTKDEIFVTSAQLRHELGVGDLAGRSALHVGQERHQRRAP